MGNPNDLLEKVERLKSMTVGHATGGKAYPVEYAKLRRELLAVPAIEAKLPRFVRTCADLAEFWGHIKEKFPTYQQRRDYLRDEFLPVISMLEQRSTVPADTTSTAVLSTVDSGHVREAWHKALERRESDPGGAITSARTLIEAVCKYILDESGVTYDDGWDLPRLYTEAAKQLKLSPSQHTEDIFKQILGGCHSVVNGMAGLRNKLSDAHGKGKKGVRPEPRHAELSVNLAGTLATFLLATWEVRGSESGRT